MGGEEIDLKICISFSCCSHDPTEVPTTTQTLLPPRPWVLSCLESSRAGLGLRLALRGQVKSDMPVIMRGVVELAITGLTQVQRSPVVQLPAVGMMAHLWVKGGDVGSGWAPDRQTDRQRDRQMDRTLRPLLWTSTVFSHHVPSANLFEQPSRVSTTCFQGMQRKMNPAPETRQSAVDQGYQGFSGRKSSPKGPWFCSSVDIGTP